jgi:hypothetical protein
MIFDIYAGRLIMANRWVVLSPPWVMVCAHSNPNSPLWFALEKAPDEIIFTTWREARDRGIVSVREYHGLSEWGLATVRWGRIACLKKRTDWSGWTPDAYAGEVDKDYDDTCNPPPRHHLKETA